MFLSFFKYFLNYILRARTRQRLLFLALFSLFLSSFALVVLQGVMNGLQTSVIAKSKGVYGEFFIDISQLDRRAQDALLEDFDDYELKAYPEKETELLIRHQAHIAPVILHGISLKRLAPFLEKHSLRGLSLGADLARKLQTFYGGKLQLVTPSEMDNFLGDIPRSVTSTTSDVIQTDVAEVDLAHAWVRENVVFNLLREVNYNKIRFMDQSLYPKVLEVLRQHCSPQQCPIKTWSQTHSSLQWALDLESRVMLFLFVAMSLLVAISIVAGLLIFHDKVKRDMASFWVLGLDRKSLYRLSNMFSYILNSLACAIGLVGGVAFLKLIENYGTDIMPDVFVERSLPVQITPESLWISFLIPLAISLFFTALSVRLIFRQQRSFLSLIRGQAS